MIIAERMITEVINEKDLIPEDTESTETKEQETKIRLRKPMSIKSRLMRLTRLRRRMKKGEDEKRRR